jgi:glycosyltransferase involved in cell wall biosynthesis
MGSSPPQTFSKTDSLKQVLMMTPTRILRRPNQSDIAEVLSQTVCVMPVFNEAQVLTHVLQEFREVFPNVLCVDDGSDDESSEIAVRLGARVVRHALNIGQGGALCTAFSLIRGEGGIKYVVTVDADGQHRPSDALAAVQLLVSSNSDVVFASRFLERDVTKIPFSKRLLLRTIVRVRQLVTGIMLTDSHNGLRAIRAEALSLLPINHFGMAHASEIVSRCVKSGLSYLEVPVRVEYTAYSRRKGQSILNSVNIALDFLWRPN